ncbi:isoleucine--tRNA ligase [Candidatus Phytoplasma phoenicium]|uniref:Isoleucine--tRNA ligase n=1 Tax=Candidatus Phytoplasma phoenicium TaxID=198422 RepID=A0A0L0MK99_9MOLU|nr:isoleucine--tRNA ligase [Candidatus Phytoplasma phoenicium]KND62691.1 Isoleucyl-tRNA synthetase [Candidatus Phytoplasma phoenicium]
MNIEYKNTLLMPKTNFPMKGNLSQKEIEIENYWEQINLYQQLLKKNKKNPKFILHDGPPYANGDIHIGHALNKILKDFIVRFKTMQGFYTPYIPGWDTHGLPIEIAVLKKLSKNKTMEKNNFLQQCQQFAFTFIEKQKKNFKRLGILGEWENPYLTFQNSFIADEIRILGKMIEKNLIFKKLKPVYWSPFLESVLAESEIEYREHQSLSIFINFKILDADWLKDVNLLIWTTTPWTLPANVAICVHPLKDYHLIENNNQKYIVSAATLDNLCPKFQWNELKILKTFKGQKLENLNYENTLFSCKGKVVVDTFVLENEGTGLVHIAPGHGHDDFLIGQKYQFPTLCSVDKKGLMTEIAGVYQGLFYEKANKVIIEDLKKNHLLLKAEILTHAYPHDERIKKPVFFLAIPQWFLNITKIKKNIFTQIEKVQWLPQWGKIKMHNMIENREDWVISRQKTWGVPIPIFYTEAQNPILDIVLINHIADLIEKNGKEIWIKWDVKDLLPTGYKHPESPNNIFLKEKDILDVWFDSGTSYSILRKLSPHFFPANIYLEGADQYRGWFNSSLITSTIAFGQTPYQQILTHGFVLDGKGQKMSKSLNNVIDPLNIIKQKGADILRLWVASTNYKIDVRIDDSILKQIEEKYRKIRNTFRFMLGNLNQFNPQKHYIPFEKREIFHRIIMLEFQELLLQIIQSYEDYNFEKVISLLYPFITNKLSAFYLDFAKDVLYIEKENNIERRVIQSNIYDILLSLLKILTPIIPHTTAEAYQTLPFKKQLDLYLENMPNAEQIKKFINQKAQNFHTIKEAFNLFYNLRESVLKNLEEARQKKIINKSAQANLILKLPEKYIKALKLLKIKKKLNKILMVAQIKIHQTNNFAIYVDKALGESCPRCWNIIPQKKENDLCQRCYEILNN